MKTWIFYKHKNCTDIIIRTVVVEDDKEKKRRDQGDRKMMVDYYNIANIKGEPRKIGIREAIKIKDEQLENWEEYSVDR